MDTIATADISDELGSDVQVIEPAWFDYGGHIAFSGPAATVRCHDDNSKVREMLESPGEGRVLVVNGGKSVHCALLGDMLGELALRNGWTGVLVYGCIRDAEAIGRMPLGVKALATHPRKSVKRGIGERDVPVRFADVIFSPGAMLYADLDGVLVTAGPA